MCLHWLTQCFWNYLDWTEICHYISTCVVMGPDYQVYMCVAIFKHLQPDILQRTQSQELQVFLKVRWSFRTTYFIDRTSCQTQFETQLKVALCISKYSLCVTDQRETLAWIQTIFECVFFFFPFYIKHQIMKKQTTKKAFLLWFDK